MTNPSLSSPRRSLTLLLRDLLKTFGNKPLLYCALIIAQGIVESLAVASVMPLLALVGMKNGGSADLISHMLNAVHITPTLTSVSLFLWVGLCVSAVLFLCQAYVGAIMQTTYPSIWRGRLADALAGSNYAALRQHSTGKLLNAFNNEATRCGDVIYQINLIMVAILHTCTTLLVASLLSPIVTLAILSLGAVLFLFSRRFLRHAYKFGQQVSRDNDGLNGACFDVIKGLKYVKATGTEAVGLAPIHTLRKHLQQTYFYMTLDMQKAKAVFDFGGAMIVACLLVIMPLYSGVEVTAILTILALFVRLLPRLVGLQQGIQLLNVTLSAIDNVHSIYDELKADQTAIVTKPLPADVATGALPCTCQNVGVTIGDATLLADVSGTVAAGQWLVIVGQSGAGKSTLLDVMCGLVSPTTGSVQFAGYDWAHLQPCGFRARLGLVEQDNVLFAGSILQNLCGGMQIDDAAIMQALTQAGLPHFVNILHEEIGGTHRVLSGGERQRLAIARALLRRPGLLILDEATSALDPQTEQGILDTLAAIKGQVTIIMTTHRPAATQYADEIWLMADGRVVERGAPITLGQTGGAFTNWLNHASVG